MKFKSLEARHFRNLDEVSVSFHENINIFVGENGQGKTNLLEALYLLCKGETFRFADTKSLLKHNELNGIIKSKAEKNNLDYLLECKILQFKKQFFLNEKPTTSTKLSTEFSVVLFSPESLASIKESAEQRRALIDNVIENQSLQEQRLLSQWRKILRSRNRILKDLNKQILSKTQGEDLLESIQPIFINSALALTEKRIKILKELLPKINNAMQYINGQVPVDISVEYRVSEKNLITHKADEIKEQMLVKLQELRSAEVAIGSSLVGPHKHDISFLHNSKDSRIFCSQGQQRALILAFKMAQIVYHRESYGTYPVLMLDDVLSELDGDKRMNLVAFLKELPTQIFITTTDVTLPDSMSVSDCSVLHVSDGNVQL